MGKVLPLHSRKQPQIENGVTSRHANKQIQRDLDSLKAMADGEGYLDLPDASEMSLFFLCECSDESCQERINVDLSFYNGLHSRKQFLIKSIHHVTSTEHILAQDSDYMIVEKFATPPNPLRTVVDNYSDTTFAGLAQS